MTPTILLGAHCDDLAFSLGGVLFDGRFGPLQPVVVYTRSNASRRHPPVAVVTISRRRQEEERRFFRRVPAAAPPLCLDRLDAPLRLGIDAVATRTIPTPDDGEAETLADRLAALPLAGGRLFAPLALGDHIDHRLVRAAALRLRAGRQLFFYEDLPYAGEMRPETIDAAVAALAAELGGRLQPQLYPSPAVIAARQWAVRCYTSQIEAADLPFLLTHPRRLGTPAALAERIWRHLPAEKE